MNSVEKTKKRSYQYWFRDGLNEIGIGIVFCILGIYFLLEFKLSQTGPIRFILDSSLILITLGSIWTVNRGIRFFKENLIYPRTGYVAYNNTRRLPRWVNGLIGGVVGAFFATFVISRNLIEWLPAITGIIISFVLLYIAFKINLLRFYILALLSFGSGILVSLMKIDSQLGICLVYSSSGIALIFSGLIFLIHYLRHTNKSELAKDE